MNRLLCLVGALLFCAYPVQAQVAKPTPDKLRDDNQKLDALEKTLAATGNLADKAFWQASKRLAGQRGTPILYAIFERGQHWQSEEGLIYVPVVALLPRKETTKLLHAYQRSARTADRVWAKEFLIEFNMSDTKQAVEYFSKPRH